MKSIILIIVTIIIYSSSYSQDISLSTITTAGGFVTNDAGISVSWSIGQIFSLTTQSEQHLTEGFQQGKLEANGTIVLKGNRQKATTVFLQFNKKGIINSAEFQLQRRYAATQNFVTIATIRNSKNTATFEYIDNNNSNENTDYRILFTNNKINKISNLANIEGTPRTMSMTIFPNPTVEQLNIKLSDTTDEKIIVNIYDVNGHNIISNIYQNIENQIVNINNLDALANGNYIVQVTNGTEIVGSQTFIKM
jgi:hypothetical protein